MTFARKLIPAKLNYTTVVGHAMQVKGEHAFDTHCLLLSAVYRLCNKFKWIFVKIKEHR
jgi:hypothetical protein